MKRHLDVDIEMQNNGDYTVVISEPETGEITGWDFKADTEYCASSFRDVMDEIRSWIMLMDEDREYEMGK